MAASDLSEWRAGVLFTGKLLGDRFGDPSVARDTAGAAQTRPIDGGPNIGIEAKALAPSVSSFKLCPDFRCTRNALTRQQGLKDAPAGGFINNSLECLQST
jgi:hypothetical protein